MTRARSCKALSILVFQNCFVGATTQELLFRDWLEYFAARMVCPLVIFYKFIVPTGCDETALDFHESNAVYFVICRRRRAMVEETLLRKKEGRNGREMKPESALKIRA